MVSDAHQLVARSQQPYAELTTLSVVFVQAQHESKQVSELGSRYPRGLGQVPT
jgi:hypothetical protein